MSSYSAGEFWKTIGLVHDLLNETSQLVRAMEQIARDAEHHGHSEEVVRARMQAALERRSEEARELLAIALLGVGDPKAAEMMGIQLDRPLDS